MPLNNFAVLDGCYLLIDCLQLKIAQILKLTRPFKVSAELRATRGDRNPNLQVAMTHAHLFELPLRMNGMYRIHHDHARFDLLSCETYTKES